MLVGPVLDPAHEHPIEVDLAAIGQRERESLAHDLPDHVEAKPIARPAVEVAQDLEVGVVGRQFHLEQVEGRVGEGPSQDGRKRRVG